jgi:TRAP-type mannitol/chloroaromatic compound transport system permease small subunit
MSHAKPAEPLEGAGDAPVVAITDPGEAGRAEHIPGDRLIVAISNVFAWLFAVLMVVICVQVVLRNAGRFGIGPGNQAYLDDLQWWLYGAAVLIGIGYAVTTNSHVRVDIFYDNYSRPKQVRTDIFALAWLFLPFVILCWDVTLDYALQSISAREGANSPNGLHALYLLKTFMNLSFLFIAAATWFAYVRRLGQITRPLWWKRLLFAFPAVAFAVNLVIYYAAIGIVIATSPEPINARQASRHWFFDTFEIGPEEMKFTVAAALVATVLIIAVAYLLRDRSDAPHDPTARAETA